MENERRRERGKERREIKRGRERKEGTRTTTCLVV
jgi:hypothetical protein